MPTLEACWSVSSTEDRHMTFETDMGPKFANFQIFFFIFEINLRGFEGFGGCCEVGHVLLCRMNLELC